MAPPHHRRDRISVAVLGATGVVGGRLIQLLREHPWFRLTELVASPRSAGLPYRELPGSMLHCDIPVDVADMILDPPEVELASPILFSALSADVAAELEPLYARRGHLVISNASTFRMDPRVPLVVPEINPEALDLLSLQSWSDSGGGGGGGEGGGIVTNPNCCVVGLCLALAPLHLEFAIEAVVVNTLQALSGAGRAGVSSLDALGNIIPFIPGEEEKIARDPLKILGAEFPISVAVHRVPVIDGHTITVLVKLQESASLASIRRAMERYVGKPPSANLPTAPARPLHVATDRCSPQPARDSMRGGGMVVTVGSPQADPVYDARFTLVVNNVVRGAAGAALLNAELAVALPISSFQPPASI